MIKVKNNLISFGGGSFKLQKIKGFSLSEVLITLVIIGVVAAITIPVLNQNIENQHYISAYKKMYSSLSQMYLRLQNDNGGNVEGIFNSTDDYPRILQNYFVGSKVCQSGKNTDICWHRKWYTYSGSVATSDENNFSSLILADGSVMLFLHMNSSCTGSLELKSNIGCARIRVDINGDRKPNRIGKDIFDFYILQDRLIARGDPLSTTTVDNVSGWGKGYKILSEGKL